MTDAYADDPNETLPTEWRAQCGCGWVGPRRESLLDADIDAVVHAEELGHAPPN